MATKTPAKQKIELNGNSRVVIDWVSPQLDSGLFPVKRIVGEKLKIQADVFADGHDQIVVVLQHRKRGDARWNEALMRHVGNDRWEAEFILSEQGVYEYSIMGWVDDYATWLRSFRKKVEAGNDVVVELIEGARLLQGAADRAMKSDKKTLLKWAESLDDSNYPVSAKIELALNSAVEAMANCYLDRAFATTCATPYTVLVERERAAFSAWYEFFPRSWSGESGKHGTFKTSENILPEISRMGFNVIYLPPIHPVGQSFRKGKNNTLDCQPDDVGSPWAVGSEDGGHKAVDPRLGTLDDFRRFIKKAAKLDLEVALDIALQCSPDHPYVKDHSEWFRWRPDGSIQYAENPPKKYQDIVPFDFECKEWQSLWHELKSIFVFWIQQGVKIFRVDNPHTKPFVFWEWLIADLKEEYPDVILLAEAFTRPKVMYRLAKVGFSHGYTYFTWRNSKEEIIAYLTELTRGEIRDYFRPNFWPNTPDILAEHLQHGGRPMFISRLILATTLSSNYGIYGPAYELCVNEALQGKEEYLNSEKYELKNWNWDAPGNLKEIITRINLIRRQNAALQRTNNVIFVPTDNPQIIAYLKKTPNSDNIILVVVNLDPYNTQTTWLHLPGNEVMVGSDRSFLVHDLLADAKYIWRGEHHFIKLEPHVCPAHIFRVYREQRREQQFDYYM